jgi:hypothetical protein
MNPFRPIYSPKKKRRGTRTSGQRVRNSPPDGNRDRSPISGYLAQQPLGPSPVEIISGKQPRALLPVASPEDHRGPLPVSSADREQRSGPLPFMNTVKAASDDCFSEDYAVVKLKYLTDACFKVTKLKRLLCLHSFFYYYCSRYYFCTILFTPRELITNIQ